MQAGESVSSPKGFEGLRALLVLVLHPCSPHRGHANGELRRLAETDAIRGCGPAPQPYPPPAQGSSAMSPRWTGARLLP